MWKNDIGFGFELVKMSQFRRVDKCAVNSEQVSHWTEKLLEILSTALRGIFLRVVWF